MNSPNLEIEQKDLHKIYYLKGLEPDPDITVSEWADEYRILPKKSSERSGEWKTDVVPFSKEIMDVLSPNDPHERIVFMKCSQISGSECGINTILYHIHLSPCPILIVQPTGGLAEKFSKLRIGPSIEEMPELKRLVKNARSRDSGNTILLKEYPGGVLIMCGSNSETSLRMLAIRILYLDECDAYEKIPQGDQIEIAEERTATFSRRKIFLTSTPLNKSTSKIEPAYLDSDQRKYYLHCPFCNFSQVLMWYGIKFDHNEFYELTSEVKYQCIECKKLIPEFHKTDMLENGKWIAKYPKRKVAGFWINGLYSPLGWKSWEEIVEKFLKWKKEKNILAQIEWTNHVLAETWEDTSGEKMKWETYYDRREEYQVPEEVLVIVCAVDIQKTRIELEFIGYGLLNESWGLEYHILYGITTLEPVWKDLELMISKTFVRDDGVILSISGVYIDSGYLATTVYQFVQAQQQKIRVFASKASSIALKPLISKPTRTNKYGILLFSIGTDEAKTMVYARLKIDEPGAGYCHFPMSYEAEYFKGITSEVLDKSFKNGFEIRVWKKENYDRNEPLDIRGYALAAITMLKPDYEAIKHDLITGEYLKPRKRRVISEGIRI